MYGPKHPDPASLPSEHGGEGSPQALALHGLFSTLVYLSEADIEHVRAAYFFSELAHAGQMRQSGEPYICHPLAVATTLAHWRLDEQTLCAALLHDVIEDTDTTAADIALRFGETVSHLVSGVSKLDRIESQSVEDAQAENFRKMLLAMANDVRVILIKMADRLHNMRTLSSMRESKRKRIARETLEIYAPIAHRLGLNDLYIELRELTFFNLYPLRARIIKKAVQSARGNQRKVVLNIQLAIRDALDRHHITATVHGREKHLFGIYQKMLAKQLSFSQINDIFGFRILLNQTSDCYLTLGVLHGLYKPMPGAFKDYIAIPKINGYQSLHTTLIGPLGMPIEIQIRTHEMHYVADSGVAAHWLYKSGNHRFSEVQKNTYQWLQSLLELQNATGDAAEFLEHVKIDLFPEDVFVFTPKGQIKSFPNGATAIDFAYAIHSDIGHRCVGALVNGIPTPISTALRNGDQVEIVVGERPNPKAAWISNVRTGKARLAIRHFFKTTRYESSVELGERLLTQALRALHQLNELDEKAWQQLINVTKAHDRNELLSDIGLGRRMAAVVARQVLRLADGSDNQREPMVISGTEGLIMKFSPCCYPIPGDPIVGIISQGHGLHIHRLDCDHMPRSHNNWIDVVWEPTDLQQTFSTQTHVVVKNIRGALGRVCLQISEAGSDIETVTLQDEHANLTTISFIIKVTNRRQLAKIFRRIRRLSEVVRINRNHHPHQ